MEQIIENLKDFLKSNGWENYKKLSVDLLSVDTKNLIIHLLNEIKLRDSDVRALLLCIPELWKDFSLEDWKFIIRKVNRPSNYRVLIDNSPCFEDIKFLYNWIGIDSIKLYKNDPEISDESKKSMDRVFPLFLHDTMRNGEYMEDFQDGTFGDIKYFREMKSRLMSQGAKPSPLPDL